MKHSILKIGLIALPLIVQADDTMETKPKECNYSVSSKSGARSKTYICNDFDLAYPNSFTNVCVYRNGSWQFGHLAYSKTTKKHKFTAKKVCDAGISVIPTQNTLDIRSPAIGDYVDGKTDILTYNKKIYTSLLAKAPIADSEAPVLCYRGESRGVSVNAVACSREPNDSNYCEFSNIGSKKYLGNWWVQYRLSNKRKPVICLGGIKVAKLDSAAAEYQEDQVKTDVKTYSPESFLNLLAAPSLGNIPEIELGVASCTILTPKNLTQRITCKNEETASFDAWVDDVEMAKSLFRKQILSSSTSGATLIYSAAIKNLEKAVRKIKDPLKKKEEQDKLDILLDEVDQKVDAGIAAMAAKYASKYPVDKTQLTENQCGVAWDPATNTPTAAYVMKKQKGVLTKVNCQTIEVYKSHAITAVAK